MSNPHGIEAAIITLAIAVAVGFSNMQDGDDSYTLFKFIGIAAGFAIGYGLMRLIF